MTRQAEPNKHIKRLAREWVGRAYKAALGHELSALQGAFTRWQAGELDAFELAEQIHRFHDGPNRELFKLYTSPLHDFLLVRAVLEGHVQEAELPEELRLYIAPLLARERESP